MLRLGREKDVLSVVNDQRGRPTLASDLARTIVKLVEKPAPYGTYHCTDAGKIVSWADFATSIFELASIDCKVKPVSTSEYVGDKTGIAPRPAYGALDLDAIEQQGIVMPDWKDSLAGYIKEELSK